MSEQVVHDNGVQDNIWWNNFYKSRPIAWWRKCDNNGCRMCKKIKKMEEI